MRSRSFVLVCLVTLAAMLGACAPLPGLSPATVAPADTTPPGATLPTTAPTAAPVVTAEVISDTAAATPTVITPITPTLAITGTAPTPGAESGRAFEGGPAPAISTYRDDVAGFEIDYPAAWSVVDVTPEIKQESLAYSVTFTSWQPQEPGGQGMPEGGSKVDVGVGKDAATSPEAAAESRRLEVTRGEFPAEITFEEPWDLGNGLMGTHWIIESRGETVHELVTAINGHRILVTGYGDPAVFEQIAMTLRVAGTTAARSGVTSPEPAAAAETPGAQAKEAGPAVATSPDVMATGGASESSTAAAQPLAATTYTVRQGDTLAKIAARFGVTVAAILQANPQITNPDRIYIGQRINIPTSGTQPPPAGTTRVNIYMIGMGGGSVGCGDQVVAVRRDVPKTAAPLTAALNLLLAQKSQYYGESGLYNALYQSNLTIASITRSGGAWTIRLTGTLRLGGVCDNPRVKAQLEQTARQFSTVKSVRYFINGQALDTVLSGK